MGVEILPESERLYELASRVVEKGSELGLTVGTAESCTGGLVAGCLTAVPGSSSVVRGGVVSYAIPVKHEVLGVSQQVLDEPGRRRRLLRVRLSDGRGRPSRPRVRRGRLAHRHRRPWGRGARQARGHRVDGAFHGCRRQKRASSL